MRRFTALLALAAAFVIVGSSVVAAKAVTAELPVFLASLLRFAVASAVLVPLHLALIGWKMRTTREEDIGLFGQALAGAALFSALLLFGLRGIGAIDASLLYATLPGVVALLARLLLGERLRPHTRDGAALALAGVIPLALAKDADAAVFVGLGLVFLAVVAEGVFAVLAKWTVRLPPLTIATAMSVHGLVLFLPFGLYDAVHFDWAGARAEVWLVVLYLGSVSTAGAFLLFYAASTRLEPRVARAFAAWIPLSAAVFAGIFLGEAVTALHLLSGILVLSGLLVIAIGRGASR